MILTAGQTQALEAIEQIHKKFPSGGGVVVINGYAGTGKTTLLKTIVAANPKMTVLAPTGKAALRVRSVAGCQTKTIHKWLYRPMENAKTGEVAWMRGNLANIEPINFHSVVVDEASMVGAEIWEDLYDTAMFMGLNVVLIGDEFQLPPVELNSTQSFSVFASTFKAHTRVNLTEVLRQATESPIIRVASALRNINGFEYASRLAEIASVPKAVVLDECLATFSAGGAILCHMNETRHTINNSIRQKTGRILSLEPGEPVLCTKNNYEIDAYNGETFSIKSLGSVVGSKMVKDRFSGASSFVNFNRVELDNGQSCVIAQEQLSNQASKVGFKPFETALKAIIKKSHSQKLSFLHTNYGYALTTHKAQGSEWPSALVLIESMVTPTTLTGKRWCYTALTRARDSVKICWY